MSKSATDNKTVGEMVQRWEKTLRRIHKRMVPPTNFLFIRRHSTLSVESKNSVSSDGNGSTLKHTPSRWYLASLARFNPWRIRGLNFFIFPQRNFISSILIFFSFFSNGLLLVESHSVESSNQFQFLVFTLSRTKTKGLITLSSDKKKNKDGKLAYLPILGLKFRLILLVDL